MLAIGITIAISGLAIIALAVLGLVWATDPEPTAPRPKVYVRNGAIRYQRIARRR